MRRNIGGIIKNWLLLIFWIAVAMFAIGTIWMFLEAFKLV